MSKKTKVGLVLGLVILLVISVVVMRIVGLGLVTAVWRTPVEPELDLLFDIALSEQDLASGWILSEAAIEETPGGEGRVYRFIHHLSQEQPPHREFIQESVLVCPDEGAAIEAYQGLYDEYLPLAITRDAPELAIDHSADEMEVGCWVEPYAGEGYDFCTSIIRYGRVVIMLNGKIGDEFLNIEAFRDVLEIASQRAALAIENYQ